MPPSVTVTAVVGGSCVLLETTSGDAAVTFRLCQPSAFPATPSAGAAELKQRLSFSATPSGIPSACSCSALLSESASLSSSSPRSTAPMSTVLFRAAAAQVAVVSASRMVVGQRSRCSG